MSIQKFSLMHTKYNNSISRISVAILICLLASGISKTNAVPTDSSGSIIALRPHLQLHRALRDVTAMTTNLMLDEPKDAASTETAFDQPQGQCLLDGVLVSETTVLCEKQKQSCRAIQKTGYCCPDYKCDCEKDGKTYLNGDKLVDPETPCTVCYCQGGEILCSSVTCFHRDDCTPKFIPGRCCPEYDNCPVSKNEKQSSVNKTLEVTTTAPIVKPEPNSPSYPKITIKEITKPIEIRITDDNKPLAIHQMLKPSTTEATTTTTTTTTSTSAPTLSASAAPTSTLLSVQDFGQSPQPTVAIIGTNGQKASVGINTESLKLSASTAYEKSQSTVTDFVPSSSAEDLNENDTVKENNSREKPISAFGSQELQRVESELANSSSKVNIKREYLVTTEGSANSVSPAGSEKYDSSESLLGNFENLESFVNNTQKNEASETDPDTAGSDNIYRIILTTDGPRLSGSTEQYLALKGSNSDVEIELSNNTNPLEQISQSTEGPGTKHLISETINEWNASNNPSISTEGPTKSTNEDLSGSSGVDFASSTTESIHHIDDDDNTMPIESNPAYPSLPEDDFSLRDVNFPLSETDDVAEDEPRSFSSYDMHKNTKILDENNFGNLDDSGSGMDPVYVHSSTTDGNTVTSSTTETAEKLLEIVQLMNSAEDTSAESAIFNATDFQLEQFRRDSENETGSGDPLENDAMEVFIGTMGSGSGSGEIIMNTDMNNKMKIKPREPTTARPMKKSVIDLDIDELGNSSGDGKLSPEDDPKLDVESLKIDENANDGSIKPETISRGNVLAIPITSPQEKTLEEADFDIGSLVDDNGIGRVQRLYLQRIF